MKTLFKKSVLFVIICLSVMSNSAKAQSNILDGVYVKEHTIERRVIPYTYLREADVMWSKRVWRIIDLREKTLKC
jgi:hypothetical protein